MQAGSAVPSVGGGYEPAKTPAAKDDQDGPSGGYSEREARDAGVKRPTPREVLPWPPHPSLGLRVSTLLPQEAIANEHTEYLQKHPEIQQILNDFVSAALVEMPDDVFHFARKHFAAPEPAKETAPK